MRVVHLGIGAFHRAHLASVRAPAERRARRLALFTAMSCDNFSGNGRVLERAAPALAEGDPALHDRIAGQGAFPDERGAAVAVGAIAARAT